MFALTGYRQTAIRLADRLPWAAMVAEDPTLLRTKDNSLQHTIAYQGPDLEAAPASRVLAHSQRLNNILRRFGTGWALHFTQEKRLFQRYVPGTKATAASQRKIGR